MTKVGIEGDGTSPLRYKKAPPLPEGYNPHPEGFTRTQEDLIVALVKSGALIISAPEDGGLFYDFKDVSTLPKLDKIRVNRGFDRDFMQEAYHWKTEEYLDFNNPKSIAGLNIFLEKTKVLLAESFFEGEDVLPEELIIFLGLSKGTIDKIRSFYPEEERDARVRVVAPMDRVADFLRRTGKIDDSQVVGIKAQFNNS
jgi:hypothetical protein